MSPRVPLLGAQARNVNTIREVDEEGRSDRGHWYIDFKLDLRSSLAPAVLQSRHYLPPSPAFKSIPWFTARRRNQMRAGCRGSQDGKWQMAKPEQEQGLPEIHSHFALCTAPGN